MAHFLQTIALTFPLIVLVRGHGNLDIPFARSGYFNGNYTYNDCGFKFLRYDLLLQRNQQAALEGKPVNYYAGSECGACGDGVGLRPPRLREYGYPNIDYFPRNVYRQNTTIKAAVVLQNPHKGYGQLRIGANLTLEAHQNINVSLANFEENLLNITFVYDKYTPRLTSFDPSTPTQFNVLTYDRPKLNCTNCTEAVYVTLTVSLPPNLVSEHATMQFNYITGHVWSCKDVTSTDCFQQNFRSCSDIRIVAQDSFDFLLHNATGKCLSNNGTPYNLKLSNCSTAGAPTKDFPTALSVFGAQVWDDYGIRNGSIVFETSGYCLDVSGNSDKSGAQVGEYPCKNQAVSNQMWWTEDLGNNFRIIRSMISRNCLAADVNGNIVQLTCNKADTAQTWKFVNANTFQVASAAK